MIEIPLGAHVECHDGRCGKVTQVVVDRDTLRVSHLVIRDSRNPFKHHERLVPLESVAGVEPGKVVLRLSKDAVSEFEPLEERQYIASEAPRDDGLVFRQFLGPGTVKAPVLAPLSHLKPEQMLVRSGLPVLATDGEVGVSGDPVIQPDTMEVSHFVVRRGPVWDRSELTLPLEAVEKVDEEHIHLKLSKADVDLLPFIPVRRRFDWAEGEPQSLDLLVAVFDGTEAAAEALRLLRYAEGGGAVRVVNGAVLVKDEAGNVTTHEPGDLKAPGGAVIGAVAGMLLGLLAGPVGAVVGGVVGAAGGGVAAGLHDAGFRDDDLGAIEQDMAPGSSALVALVERRWAEDVMRLVNQARGTIVRQALTDAMVDTLTRPDAR